MSRTATGLSKKANRENRDALNVYFVWRNQFGIDHKVDAEFAWVMTNGLKGSRPVNWGTNAPGSKAADLPAEFDVIQIAKIFLKQGGTI